MANKKMSVSFPEELVVRLDEVAPNRSRFLQLVTTLVLDRDDLLTPLIEELSQENEKKEPKRKTIYTGSKDPTDEDFVPPSVDAQVEMAKNYGGVGKEPAVAKVLKQPQHPEEDGPPPCPECGSNARQEYKWKPDLEPTHFRHRCHDCGYDSGMNPIPRDLPEPVPMTPEEIAEVFGGEEVMETPPPDSVFSLEASKAKGAHAIEVARNGGDVGAVLNCNHLDHGVLLFDRHVACDFCKKPLHFHKRAETLNGGVWKCHCGAVSSDNGQKWGAPEEEVW